MQKLILCVGIVASGKSTWARAEVAKNPNIVRVNRDDIRVMTSNYVYSEENEKLVVSIRDHVIKHALKKGRDVIVDDCNINRRNFKDICTLVKSLSVDCMVMEKSFYVELDEAIARNAKRTGHACIPENVIHDMWKKSGGKQHQFYKPRVEVFNKNVHNSSVMPALVQDSSKPKAIICDIDGSLAILGDRSPYDAAKSDEVDSPNMPVVETVRLYYEAGYKVIFCSGREDKFEDVTKSFIERCLPGIEYQLFMRKTADFRGDDVVKEEIFNNNIRDNYYVLMVMDDRNRTTIKWREIGLTCFQVAPGDF
jgi:predicted kinase